MIVRRVSPEAPGAANLIACSDTYGVNSGLLEHELERSRNQVNQSLDMQRAAMQRFKVVTTIALPLLLICLGLIAYLVAKYF
jgi:hypothetical protein